MVVLDGGNAILCDGVGETRTVEVTVDADAPPGPITFDLLHQNAA